MLDPSPKVKLVLNLLNMGGKICNVMPRESAKQQKLLYVSQSSFLVYGSGSKGAGFH